MPGGEGGAARLSVTRGEKWGRRREGRSGREETGRDRAAGDRGSAESLHLLTKPARPAARALPVPRSGRERPLGAPAEEAAGSGARRPAPPGGGPRQG